MDNVKSIANHFAEHEIIVVNDGSNNPEIESFFDLLKDAFPQVQYFSYAQNRGKGYALRTGAALAKYEHIILTDFDFPYEMRHLAEMVQRLQQGYDIVTGRRNQSYYEQLPLKRKIASTGYRLCNRWFLKLKASDTQSGIKALNGTGRKVLLETTTDRFLADAEFILRASRYGLRHHEMEVTLRPNIHFSNFTLKQYRRELEDFIRLVKLQKHLPKRQGKQSKSYRLAAHQPKLS